MNEDTTKPTSDSPSFFRSGVREPVVPTPGLEPGKIVGDFELLTQLGQGGMGQVWEARQISLSRHVAVKFVRPERVTEHQLELFAREARAGGRLSHSGIVAVYGHGESDGLAWIAMELVSGAWDLRDFLDEITRMGEVPEGYDRKVAQFVAKVAEAVQAAHEAGVIHRDLKPQNILITESDDPKVTDFGLARIVDEAALSHTGDFAGTYFYMSPEQVAAKRAGLDHRTDVFSLGIVLYEMLSLVRPFQGDTEHQVAEQILMKDPVDPRMLRSKVPRDLAVICMKALEKDRDKRFASMVDVAADLRRWLANESILAKPPTRIDRAVKWCRRNPTKSVAGVTSSVLILIILNLLFANLSTTRELEDRGASLVEANSSLIEQKGIAESRARVLEVRTLALKIANLEAEESKNRAEANERVADEARLIAKDQTLKVFQQLAVKDINDLIVEADDLWPITPDSLASLRSWFSRAQLIVSHKAMYERNLERIRRMDSDLPKESTSAIDVEFGSARGNSDSDNGREPALCTTCHTNRSIVDVRIADGDPQASKGSSGLSLKRGRDLQELQLLTLLELLKDLETELMARDVTTSQFGWSVLKRIEYAESVSERSVDGEIASSLWSKAIAEISSSPIYQGLVLSPQLGLLPLGKDPVSGLWEFAHLLSGDVPIRGEDGMLKLEPNMGLVFVLIPRQSAASLPSPGIAESLLPYFISKYEMTQRQWSEFNGSNPSTHQSIDAKLAALHPVETVRLEECIQVLSRMGLMLPSESQWEVAARGTAADIGQLEFEKPGSEIIGGTEANGFGIHEAVGNVWELCSNGYTRIKEPGGKDLSKNFVSFLDRVIRGGGFRKHRRYGGQSLRYSFNRSSRRADVGLRPVRMVDGLTRLKEDVSGDVFSVSKRGLFISHSGAKVSVYEVPMGKRLHVTQWTVRDDNDTAIISLHKDIAGVLTQKLGPEKINDWSSDQLGAGLIFEQGASLVIINDGLLGGQTTCEVHLVGVLQPVE